MTTMATATQIAMAPPKIQSPRSSFAIGLHAMSRPPRVNGPGRAICSFDDCAVDGAGLMRAFKQLCDKPLGLVA